MEKNKKTKHISQQYIFLVSFLLSFVKYIHRTRQMASIMMKILLVQSVTKIAVPPLMSQLTVLLIKWIHQPTVTFKLREAFITLWRSNGSQSKSSIQDTPPQLPSPANKKNLPWLLWFFSCIIEVYYHPEVQNRLSMPVTHTNPSIIM